MGGNKPWYRAIAPAGPVVIGGWDEGDELKPLRRVALAYEAKAAYLGQLALAQELSGRAGLIARAPQQAMQMLHWL